jgi:hypothetical protein
MLQEIDNITTPNYAKQEQIRAQIHGAISDIGSTYLYTKNTSETIARITDTIKAECARVLQEHGPVTDGLLEKIQLQCRTYPQDPTHLEIVPSNRFTTKLFAGIIDPQADITQPLVEATCKAVKDPIPFNNIKDWLSKKYGPRMGHFIAVRLAKAIRRSKDECLSHLRVARANIPVEVEEYKRTKADGCCGFWDEELTFTHRFLGITIWEEKILIGFNYGH